VEFLPKPSDPANTTSLVKGLLGVVVSLVGLSYSAYFLSHGGNFARKLRVESRVIDVKDVSGESLETCGPPPADLHPVVVDMVYSEDKKKWIDVAADRFSKLCHYIQVKTRAMPDIDSADAILAREVKPTLWSPAGRLIVRYLDYRWKQRTGKSPFPSAEHQSLAKSPLVGLLWEDRRRVIERLYMTRPMREGPWFEYACANVPRDPKNLESMAHDDLVPGTWLDVYNPAKLPKEPPPAPGKKDAALTYEKVFPTLAQIRQWGRVKFVHTSPTRAASGLEALYMMAYDYALPPSARREGISEAEGAAEFTRLLGEKREAFGRWLRRCEGGLGPPEISTELLTSNMFHVGASRYDAVVTYEHLIFSVFEQIDDNATVMSEMRVLYPRPTVVNDHPAALFDPEGRLSADEREAARRWIAYLRSPEIQQLAVGMGLRPVIPEVSVREFDDPNNPFLHFRRYGVQVEDDFVEPPMVDGKVVQDMIRTWEDATGRN